MYYLNHKTLCLTSNPALGSAELPFLVQKNERAPPYVMPLEMGTILKQFVNGEITMDCHGEPYNGESWGTQFQVVYPYTFNVDRGSHQISSNPVVTDESLKLEGFRFSGV